MTTVLDHYESELGRVYSWMVGDPHCQSKGSEINQPAPSVQLAAGAVSINRLLAYTRTGNVPGNSEVLGRKSWPRRQKWFSDYIKAIMERDLRTP